MSGNKVCIRSAAEIEAVRLADLRASEAAERALRLRTQLANEAVAQANQQYQETVARMDAAASRLPDLDFQSPVLPSPPEHADVVATESYGTTLRSVVAKFERELDAAIASAEYTLARRVATAKAWRHTDDTSQQIAAELHWAAPLAKQLGEPIAALHQPAKPRADADLEQVQAYQVALQGLVAQAKALRQKLAQRVDASNRSKALIGTAATAHAAGAALQAYENAQRTEARAKAQRHLDETLRKSDFVISDFSPALQGQLSSLLDMSHSNDVLHSITAAVARERVRATDVTLAHALAAQVPDLVHSHAAIARRWNALVGQLQLVAQGVHDYTPSLEHEHRQLQADCRRLVALELAKTDWICAMNAEGFEVIQGEREDRLYVIDLTNPDVWLEGNVRQSEHGEFALAVEMQTDLPDNTRVNESELIDHVCSRVTRAVGSSSPGIKTIGEEVNRKPTIERARRPAAAKKPLQRSIDRS
jgi:hypothetical protein